MTYLWMVLIFSQLQTSESFKMKIETGGVPLITIDSHDKLTCWDGKINIAETHPNIAACLIKNLKKINQKPKAKHER